MKVILWFINFISKDIVFHEKIVNKILYYLSANSKKSFYTYHARPIFSKDVYFDHYENLKTPKVGVIIQGPIRSENDFTVQSALLYKKTMSDATILISTWSDELSINDDFLIQNDIHIIRSEKPSTSGLGTTNYQIVSTFAAVEYLERLGCDYVMKTRSDQRVYAQNIIPFFFSLLKAFPSKYKNQKNRIIELSMNICRYRPYSMCDMFQFGHIEDMKLMWGVNLDPRNQSTASFGSVRRTSRNVSESFIGEIYIHRKYLQNIGANDDVLLRTYYQNLVDYFIVIDKEQLDLYWDKYNSMEYGIAENPLYNESRQKSRIYFRDWLTMYYSGVETLSIDDRLMDNYE